jgi:hypothetical protein
MKVDEFYKEWSGKHHTTNSCIPFWNDYQTRKRKRRNMKEQI